MARRTEKAKRMNRANAKAAIGIAKAQQYPGYDRDVRHYGKETAAFNAGFLIGWDKGMRNAMTHSMPAILASAAKKKAGWNDKEKRAIRYAVSFFKRFEKRQKAKSKRSKAGKLRKFVKKIYRKK
jgi:hypothetical protein